MQILQQPFFLRQETEPGFERMRTLANVSSVFAPTSGKTFRMRVTRTALSPATEKYFPTGLWLLQSGKDFCLWARAVANLQQSFFCARKPNPASRECSRLHTCPRFPLCAGRTLFLCQETESGFERMLTFAHLSTVFAVRRAHRAHSSG